MIPFIHPTGQLTINVWNEWNKWTSISRMKLRQQQSVVMAYSQDVPNRHHYPLLNHFLPLAYSAIQCTWSDLLVNVFKLFWINKFDLNILSTSVRYLTCKWKVYVEIDEQIIEWICIFIYFSQLSDKTPDLTFF